MHSACDDVDTEASIITPQLLQEERAIFGSIFDSPENKHALENTDIVRRHSHSLVCNKHKSDYSKNEQHLKQNAFPSSHTKVRTPQQFPRPWETLPLPPRRCRNTTFPTRPRCRNTSLGSGLRSASRCGRRPPRGRRGRSSLHDSLLGRRESDRGSSADRNVGRYFVLDRHDAPVGSFSALRAIVLASVQLDKEIRRGMTQRRLGRSRRLSASTTSTNHLPFPSSRLIGCRGLSVEEAIQTSLQFDHSGLLRLVAELSDGHAVHAVLRLRRPFSPWRESADDGRCLPPWTESNLCVPSSTSRRRKSDFTSPCRLINEETGFSRCSCRKT